MRLERQDENTLMTIPYLPSDPGGTEHEVCWERGAAVLSLLWQPHKQLTEHHQQRYVQDRSQKVGRDPWSFSQ